MFTPADERILKYVLAEIMADDCRMGDVLSAAIRSLSNLATLGRNVNGPAGIKKFNPYVSKAAIELKESGISFKQFCSLTISEHQMPISVLIKKWIDQKDTITGADIWSDLQKWHMVTITKEENSKINRKGLSFKWSENRYDDIEIVKLSKGLWDK